MGHAALATLARQPGAPDVVVAEARRLAAPTPTAPDDWEHLWHLGPSEIYRRGHTEAGDPCIGCETHGDVEGRLNKKTPACPSNS